MIHHEHIVCPFCALLCDDLTVEVEGNEIISCGGCPKAQTRFLQVSRTAVVGIEPTIEGKTESLEHALRRAGRVLMEARRPLVLLSGQQSNEATGVAADLAAAVGAVIDGPRDIAGTLHALTSTSLVSATLGEVRNRADVIICWRCDPVTTHPRLMERMVEAPGLYRPHGRADRTLVVVDERETATAKVADLWLRPAHDTTAATSAHGNGSLSSLVWTLRALVAGRQIDGQSQALDAGLSLETLMALVEQLRTARYGALFYAESPGVGDRRRAAIRGGIDGIAPPGRRTQHSKPMDRLQPTHDAECMGHGNIASRGDGLWPGNLLHR